MHVNKLLSTVIFTILLTGCSVNPVTGKREVVLISESQEISLGAQNYAPMQQSQGGLHDADPELGRYVQEVGGRLAAVSDRPLPYEFVVLNNSVPNAWALPGGKIAINRGLLTELNSEAELAAVLGHEIVHAAARHSAQQQTRAMLSQVLVVATAVAASDSDYGNLAVGSASVGAQLISARYGRGAELESDKYGMQYMSKAGYDPRGAVTLQETFVRLSEGRRSDWLSGLFASHPPSPERVAANVATAAALPATGILGVDRYEAAMKKTRAAKPAYDSYDEGRKALSEKRTGEALALANEAIKAYPQEAHFYSLRGDVRLVDEQYEKAITNFDSAIRRREGFFYYHLQRGLAKKELGRNDAATVDLERSIELFPTAPAHYALGEIAEENGNLPSAIEQYSVVAKSGGEYGKAASARLLRIDLPRQPAKYLRLRCDPANDGNLLVSVQNSTAVVIQSVKIRVQYTDNVGRARQIQRGIPGRLSPGQVGSVNTGLGPYTGGSCPATVVAARIAE